MLLLGYYPLLLLFHSLLQGTFHTSPGHIMG